MIRWTDNISEWDGSIPAALIRVGATADEQPALGQAMVARALDVPRQAVVIERVKDHRPVVARPMGSGLHLSTAARGTFSAVAVAHSPIGVDVELVDAGENPWNVLHEAEAAILRALQGTARASAFARLWSLKEAYVKALGVGLSQEPSSFAASFLDEESAILRDPANPARIAEAWTTWRTAGEASAAIAVVILDRS